MAKGETQVLSGEDDDLPSGAGDQDRDGGQREDQGREESGRADTHVELEGGDVYVDDDGLTEDERDRRERNRERRREKKARRDREVHALREQLAQRDTVISDLQTRVSNVETTGRALNMAEVDRLLAQAEQAREVAAQVQADAIKKGDTARAQQALDQLLDAREAVKQIKHFKENAGRQQRGGVDPVIRSKASAWASKNPWYDVNGRDPDSKVVQALDASLAQQGLNPSQDSYWVELDKQVNKYLPHRVKSAEVDDDDDDEDEAPPARRQEQKRANGAGNGAERRRPPTAGGGGSGRSPSNGGGGFVLSAERVRAMRDAGIWDDPDRRKRQIDAYKKYDRETGAQGR